MRPRAEEFSAEHGVRQSQSRAAELQNCRRFSPQKAVAKFSQTSQIEEKAGQALYASDRKYGGRDTTCSAPMVNQR